MVPGSAVAAGKLDKNENSNRVKSRNSGEWDPAISVITNPSAKVREPLLNDR